MRISSWSFSLHSYLSTIRQNRRAINKNSWAESYWLNRFSRKTVADVDLGRNFLFTSENFNNRRDDSRLGKTFFASTFFLQFSSTLKIAKFIGPLTLIKCFHGIYGRSDNALWKVFRVGWITFSLYGFVRWFINFAFFYAVPSGTNKNR